MITFSSPKKTVYDNMNANSFPDAKCPIDNRKINFRSQPPNAESNSYK